ncbi:MAG: 1-pyrroline-5-carboxylate dehydrogenase, partial [Flavobacteriaceae bacterium]
MSKGNFYVPEPSNEPVLSYAPGTAERKALSAAIKEGRKEKRDIPMYIGGEEIRTGKTIEINPPYDHKHVLGQFHEGDASHVQLAIDAALKAKKNWENLSWEHRATIFLKAAELIA